MLVPCFNTEQPVPKHGNTPLTLRAITGEVRPQAHCSYNQVDRNFSTEVSVSQELWPRDSPKAKLSAAMSSKTTQRQHNKCARKSTYHESLFLLSCLEAAMTKLGGCVNELQVNLLQGPALGLHKQGLKKERCQVSMQQQCPPVHLHG